MHTVYHAHTLIDAHLVKDRLESEGIPAFIAGEYLTGGVGQLPARGLISVAVPDSCVSAAEPLVREAASMLADARADDVAGAGDPGFAPVTP